MYLKQSYAVAGLDLYPGTEMGFDFKSVLFSFFFQVSGSLPLSYIAHLFERVFHTYLITFTIISLACIFIYFKRAQIVLLDKKIVIFSMFIIFSAALPVALSQHHSSWVSFGYPYIPVFIQNLALAAILAALVSNTIAVRGLLFMIIFVSSIPNYVLFHELNKKDGPVRLVFDLFRLQDYKIKPQFDKTFIVDGSEFGMDVKFVQSKARAELGEIYFTNIGKAVYKKGAVSNTIILSKSSYKNTIAVMGEIDKGNEIKNPTYISPNRACVEKISLDKDKIISYKTHRDTVIFTYSDPGYYRSENKLSCNFNYSLYDRLMDKFIPKY